MLNTWIENLELKALIENWSQAIDLDLLHLGTTADAEEIKDTANAQPLIVATSSFKAVTARSLYNKVALSCTNASLDRGDCIPSISRLASSRAFVMEITSSSRCDKLPSSRATVAAWLDTSDQSVAAMARFESL